MTALRWCKCKHVDGTHWAGDPVEEALIGHELPFRCRAKTKGKDCDCTEFRPRKSNPIRHFLTVSRSVRSSPRM